MNFSSHRSATAPTGRGSRWLGLVVVGALTLPGSAQAQGPLTLTPDEIKVTSIDFGDTGGTFTVKYDAASGLLSYTLDYNSRSGSGTFKIQAPASPTGLNLGTSILLQPAATFTVKQTTSGNVGVRTAVHHAFQDLDCTFTSGDFPCLISKLEVDLATARGYLDATISVRSGSFPLTGRDVNVRAYFSTSPPKLKAGAIEAVQTVQWSTDDNPVIKVPLIAGKSTILRLYPEAGSQLPDPAPKVTGTLRLSRNGVGLGELKPFNGPIPAAFGTHRLIADGSLNFRLAPELATGTVDVEGVIALAAGQTGNVDNKPSNQSFQFQPQAKSFVVRFFELCHQPPGEEKVCPTDRVWDYAQLMNKLYPAADNGIQYVPLFIDPPTWGKPLTDDSEWRALVVALRTFDSLIRATVPDYGDQLVAWLPGGATRAPDGRVLRGNSDPLFKGGKGQVSFCVDATDREVSFFRSGEFVSPLKALAHEIGHNLGLRHTTGVSDEDDQATAWPYNNIGIQEPGFDPFTKTFIDNFYFDLMSYGEPTSRTWIAPYTFEKLFRSRFQPSNADPRFQTTKTVPEASAATGDEYIILSGSVNANQTTGTLNPAYRVNSAVAGDSTDPAGNYCLRFSNAAATLSDFCFQLTFTSAESGGKLDFDSFSYQIPFPAGTKRIALRHGSQQLTAIDVSASAPLVTITSPKAGDVWNAGQQTIAWSASDADGNPLTFTVLYSPDGNAYTPLQMDLTARQFTINSSRILGGAQVYFKVIATDGVNTTSSVAGPIRVVQSPRLEAGVSELDFGNGTAGQFVERELLIASTGTGPVNIVSYRIDNPVFEVLYPAAGFMFNATGKRSMLLRYMPSGSGIQSGVLTIVSDDPTRPNLQVRLTGKAFTTPVPNMEVAPSILDFGSVASGQSKDLPFVIANTASAELTVTSASTSNSRFTLISPATPFQVGPGIEVQGKIRFVSTPGGAQSGTITLAGNDPSHATRSIAVAGSTGPSAGAPPQINAGGIVNAASFQTPLARGSLATVFGVNLATSSAQASQLPLPLSLGGAQITVGGRTAPLFFAGPGQINFQVPFEAPLGQSVPVAISRDGVTSNTGTVQIVDDAPGIFAYARTAGALDPIVVHADNKLVTPANPARAGETLIVYATGLGSLNNPPATGAAAPASPPATARVTPTVTVGGSSVQVQFAGLTPFLVGLVQLNILLPTTLPAGNSLPLRVSAGAVSSQAGLTLAVDGPPAPVPVISVSPTSLDFGTVTTGQPKDLALTVRNNGNATLTVTSISSSNQRFALTAVPTPFNVGPGSFQTATIRFSPNDPSAQTGTLTIASNDPARPTVTVPLTGSGTTASSTQLTLTNAAGWPNGRTSNQVPALAIDGSTSTYTWTTESFNTAAPSYLGVSLAAVSTVSRLRIYKDNDAGGPGLIAKDLTIEYTTSDPSIALASRTWTRVSGLTNGFNGTELMTAASINANGTVTADNHVSQTSGFASLSFTPVNATGIRIGFSNSTPISVNHYRVYELQLYGTASAGGGPGQTPISVGQTVTGTLTTSSPRSIGCPTCYAATYRLTVASSQRIDIRLNSSAFDAFLQILDTNGTILSDDDDSGGGTNSRIVGTFAAGTYLIEASTAIEGQTGAYVLSLTAVP